MGSFHDYHQPTTDVIDVKDGRGNVVGHVTTVDLLMQQGWAPKYPPGHPNAA